MKALIYAIAIGGLVASAQAADLGGKVTEALPAIPDGPITWMGVTFYGTVDFGYTFNSNGLPASGSFFSGAAYTIFGNKAANGAVSTITNNALEQSKIGLKIDEKLGYDFTAVGKLETGFNPISGELADACASLLRNNGKPYFQQDVNGDGSRCGQAFNGVAYGGLSHPLFGTLTVGRQSSLVLDGMSTYDPMALSYAFSTIGYSGTAGPGIGSTETARWDNSVKYVFSYGPFHAAGMFTNGGQDTPMVGQGYGANAGFTWQGFSVDGYYTRENGAVNLSTIPNPANSGTLTAPPLFPAGLFCVSGGQAGAGFCPNALKGTITNNEAWDVMAKYTFELWGLEPGLKDGGTACGLKDGPCPPSAPPAKLTFFGGYQHVDLSNPEHSQSFYNGFTTIGGYQYLTSGNLAFGTDKILQTVWAGARFETGPWAVTGAWYYVDQNSFLSATGANCTTVTKNNIKSKTAGFFQGNPVATNCSGNFNQGSFLVDYTFNRHFDIYAGVSYSEISGGLNSGYLSDNDLTFAMGLRIKW